MIRFFYIICSYLLISTFSHSALAADSPNILVIGEDGDESSIARNSRIFKRVVNHLTNQMHDKGFNVYDETFVTLEFSEQGRNRRSDAEILSVARAINNPPIDIVVLFSLYSTTQTKNFTTSASARLGGRLVDVKSGRNLGSFEVGSDNNWLVPSQCNYECYLNTMGDKASTLANDLGAILAEKLSWQLNSSPYASSNALVADYQIIFDGFSTEEYNQLEEYLVVFSGYQNHRPVETSYTRSDIQYKSTSSSAKLSRNINKMLVANQMRASVNFINNAFHIKRITFRNRENASIAQGEW